MTTFAQAALKTVTHTATENGMAAQTSSLSYAVDYFYKAGASRGQNLNSLFESVYAEDKNVALRLAQWTRDVRGGAGERKIFRDLLKHLEKLHPQDLINTKLLDNVPTIGRWDDLLIFEDARIKSKAYDLIINALNANDGLCAKWMPRQGAIAAELRFHAGLPPKTWRKLLVNLTKVVETQMCANDWSSINYSHVPSKAMTIYNKSFAKHSPAEYQTWKDSLAKGETKVNAAAVYPYEVIKTIKTDSALADEMWKALPDYMSDANVLPLADVSGSMGCPAGGMAKVSCMDISISLALYCSSKNTGPFKDVIMPFSGKAKVHKLSGSLSSKMTQLARFGEDWGCNTDLEGAFNEILRIATTNNLPEEEMPKIILLLSDMQFDPCQDLSKSAIDMIADRYEKAGYQIPKIVFWNLAGNRTSNNNVPVSFDSKGTAMVSGFSPALMKSILKVDLDDPEKFTPKNIMLQTIMSERYDF